MFRTLNNLLVAFTNGDPSLFGASKPTPDAITRYRYEQRTTIARLTPAMVFACICNAILALVVITHNSTNWAAILWAFPLISICAFLYIRSRDKALLARFEDHQQSSQPLNRTILMAGTIGFLWMALPVLFYDKLDSIGQVVLLCITIGALCGGAFAFSTLPAAAVAFIAPISTGALLAIAGVNGAENLALTTLLLAYTFALLRAVVTYSNQLLKKVIEHADAEADARRDPLTGLMNRKALEEYMLEMAIAPLHRNGAGFCVLYLDLDHFKLINDTFGHATGDALLQQVAERLAIAVRPSDCVARVGGDEFCIVCTNVNETTVAAKLADRVLRQFDAPIRIAERSLKCRPSIGISVAPNNGDTPADLIKNADIALYQCKQHRRGSYAFFTKDDDERVKRRLFIGSSIKKGMDANEFHIDYQPIFETHSLKLAGFEALLRWRHPEIGLIPPSEFIPLAEELDLIHDLGNWLISTVCKHMVEWPSDIRASVNFSPIQLRSPRLAESILAEIERNNIDPSRFEVELTETVSLDNCEIGANVLSTLREAGITVALDDFGTGYSSLAYLCKLPIDRIKIDRSFISTGLENPLSAAIIQAVVALAKSLGKSVVAEGVETEAQLLMLAKYGCDEVQGYLLSRPISHERATKLTKFGENSELLTRVA